MPAAPNDSDVVLSDLQLDLMRVLWQHGELPVTDVAAALATRRDLAHTTVATLLTRLAKRGVVTARRDGRQLYYRALISESQARRGMVAELIDRLFSGDPRALLAHLVSEREVAARDLEKIQALLAAPVSPARKRKP